MMHEKLHREEGGGNAIESRRERGERVERSEEREERRKKREEERGKREGGREKREDKDICTLAHTHART